jgi:hypothetical protein
MPRGSLKDWNENRAIDFFKLRQKKSERIVVIDWNGTSIRQYETAEKLIEDFVAWRLAWFKVRYENKVNRDEYELGFWKGVKACFDDKLPARLGGIKDRASLDLDVQGVTSKLKLDDKRIDRIVNLPAHRWTKDAYADVLARIKDLEAKLKENRALVKDPAALKAIYRSEVEALKKVKFQ